MPTDYDLMEEAPAFPSNFDKQVNGMRLLDYFAARAMQSFIVTQGKKLLEHPGEELAIDKAIAEAAYQIASAMLDVREREMKGDL